MMKKFIILCGALVALTVNAQMFIPPFPVITNIPFGTNVGSVNGWYVTSLNWNTVSNASQYDVYGGDMAKYALTNHLITVDSSTTNAWFQGTNAIYFFRVSANITN